MLDVGRPPTLSSRQVQFDQWSPDLPGYAAARAAQNVIPGPAGYRPFPGFAALETGSQAITGEWTSGFVARAGDGAIDVLATTATTIYRWDGDEWVSVNTGFTDGDWRFEQWGDEIVATNPTHGFHYANIGGTFTADSGAPAARFVARCDQFVFLGGLDGFPNAVQWSGFDDRATWDIGNVNKQSDINYMPRELGALTGLRRGQQPIIFQEQGISVGRYVGPPFVWEFRTVEDQLGCIASRSIQPYRDRTFFLSAEGPAEFTASGTRLLGDGRFQRWFQEAIEGVTQAAVHSAIDTQQKIIVWAWRPDSAEPATQGVIYHYALDRAAEWRPGAAYPILLNLPASIASTNELTTTTIGSYSGDALQTRTSGVADRPRTAEVRSVIGSINPDNRLGRFTDTVAPLEAVMDTQEVMSTADHQPRMHVRDVRPLVDAPPTSVYGSIITRQDAPGDVEHVGAEVPGHDRGHIPLLAQGRTHRVRVRIPAGVAWTHATGLTFNIGADGEL